MRLGMIWAQARNGAIGRAGEMPWHLPEDLAHFKQTTLGAPVIMGRRTWESLPERFRPLPGRTNYVVTRDPAYVAAGAEVRSSLEAILESADAADAEIAWIIGGGELYRAAMGRAEELVVTRIDLDVDDADTFAPEITSEWERAVSGEVRESKSGIGYRFERWLRGERGAALSQADSQ